MKFGSDRRVRKRPEFQAIQRAGRRIPTKHFVLIVAPASEPDNLPRLGITASKKVGNAVRRNRLKRIVRAAFRATEGFLPPGFDLLVICTQDCESLTAKSVVSEWRSVEKQVKKALFQAGSREKRPSEAGKAS